MTLNSLNDDFTKYYINQTLPHDLKLNSRELANVITSGKTNSIQVGRKVIEIPLELSDYEYNSNSKISTYSNADENVFYVDPSIKRFYQVGETISVSRDNLENNEVIQLSFNCKSVYATPHELLVIEYENSRGINSRVYNSGTIDIYPDENTTNIALYIIPADKDFYFDIQMNVKKSVMDIFREHHVIVNKETLYIPRESIKIVEEEKFSLDVPKLNKDFIYFSVDEKNNSFNKLPKESLIEVNPKHLYKFTAPFHVYDEIDFTPTIIEYNKTGKTNLIKLTSHSEFVKLQNDTKSIRLSYRFSGEGRVSISDVNIIEYQPETEYQSMEWNNRFEIDTHMNLINSVEQLRIACIMDEFTYHSYKEEAILHRLSYNNWKAEIDSFLPNFVFIESAWHGNNEEWTKRIAYVTEEKHKDIKRLIEYCNEKCIPVVFWNKEDPLHYDHFIKTAQLCDYVFTTDADKIKNYKIDCNHENVQLLQFAAQPKVHNPTKIQKEREKGISFAGSYYALREERSKDMDRLFEAAIPFGLTIYDRNYEYTKKGERLNFLFPEQFREYIVGTLPFYKIQKAYKGYQYMININTIKESPTMYARRVYEGLASGTPIISNYSNGMIKQFGHLIGYSEEVEELQDHMKKLEENPSEYNRLKQLGIRTVMNEHTYRNRLLEISSALGYQFSSNEDSIVVLGFAKDESEEGRLLQTFQEISSVENHLLIITDSGKQYSDLNNRVTYVRKIDIENNFSTLKNLISTDFILPIHPNHFYSKNYLADLMLARRYANSDVIGKTNYYSLADKILNEVNPNSEHEYTADANPFRSLINSTIFEFMDLQEALSYLNDFNKLSELLYLGVTIYSNDKMNFIENGFTADINIKKQVII